MPPVAILDVDGTLVDTNYHHAIACYRAFMRNDVVLPVWRIHRAIGMRAGRARARPSSPRAVPAR
jgi:beta-phosphoglucomutase-like phosphatase (HAD superfamily)